MIFEILLAATIVLLIGVPAVIAFDKAKKELREADEELERKERAEE